MREQKEEEEDEEQDRHEAVDYELLRSFIPSHVLRFLLDPNPLGV